MKKTLRFLFTAMLMTFGMTAMAEDVIWSEDFSAVTDFTADPANYNSNYTFTGTVLKDDGSGTVKSGTKFYDENLAGGTAPELLIAKNGGSFAARIDLNGKSGDMVFAFKSNKKLDVTAQGATLGEVTNTGNDYIYPVTVAAGTSEITITVTQSQNSNARVDNFKLYQGTAKKPAGLSWGKGSTTLTIGEEVGLTLSNDNNLPVSFSSSDETVATIDANGTITLIAAGKTTITAEFAGNDEYEAQSVSIEVTVKEKSGDEPGPVSSTITVAKALEIIAGLDNRATTNEEYDVEGIVVNVTEFSPKPDGYGNATFDISDTSNGDRLTVFRAKNNGGVDFTTDDVAIAVGEKVVVRGKLQKYVKNDVVTPEIATGGQVISRGTSTVISSVNEPVQSATIYNLRGQQVKQASKGLYIINGKKVIK